MKMKTIVSVMLTVSIILTLLSAFCVSAVAAEGTEASTMKWVNKNGNMDGWNTSYRYYYYSNNYEHNTNANPAEDTSTMQLDFQNVFMMHTGGYAAMSANAAMKAVLDEKGMTQDNTFYNLEYNGAASKAANHYALSDAHEWLADRLRQAATLYDVGYWTASGLTFVAPKTGTIKVAYQFGGIGSNANNNKLHMGTNDLAITAGGSVTGAQVSVDGTSSVDLTVKYAELNVVEGDTVYFILDGTGNTNMFSFWISEVEYLAEAEAEVIGHNLASTDSLLVRFFVDFNAAPSTNCSVTATVNGEPISLTGTQWIDETGAYGKVCTADDFIYCYTVPMNAKEMTDEIDFSVKLLDEELCSDTYSVQEYCNYYIEQYNTDGSNAEVAKACASMLLYGRMTQLALNYNTENLPQIDADLLNEIINAAN